MVLIIDNYDSFVYNLARYLRVLGFSGKIPILGVCLGHQVIGQHYGAQIKKSIYPMHGKSSLIQHSQQGILQNIETPFKVGRYHSLIVSRENFPETELDITASTAEDEIMAIQHRQHPTFGVQFHPESILTDSGYEILKNFLA